MGIIEGACDRSFGQSIFSCPDGPADGKRAPARSCMQGASNGAALLRGRQRTRMMKLRSSGPLPPTTFGRYIDQEVFLSAGGVFVAVGKA